MDLKSILRKIRRFNGEKHYAQAVLSIEMTFFFHGPIEAARSAARIAEAYKDIRAARWATQEQKLRAQARREGWRLAA